MTIHKNTAPGIAPEEQCLVNDKWYGRRDSNSQPSAWEAHFHIRHELPHCAWAHSDAVSPYAPVSMIASSGQPTAPIFAPVPSACRSPPT